MATDLVDMVPLEGNIATGDALYCQREYCSKVLAAGGDYLVIVKGNQRTLYEDIKLAFALPVVGGEYRFAEDRGRHGDRKEVRRLWATTALNEYPDWPGVKQVCKIEREVDHKGKVTRDVRYAITPLGDEPERLQKYIRGIGGLRTGSTMSET